MGTIVKIALRNIFRHKRRTISSAVVIAVGIMFYLYMDGIMLGMDRTGIDNAIDLSSSALKLHTKEYEEDKEAFPMKHGLKNLKELRTRLEKDKRVTGVTPRAQFIGELSNYEKNIPVIGIVIDPKTDSTVFKLTSRLEGGYLSDDAGQVIIGTKLAEDLGVKVGGFVTLYALTRYDSRNADEFQVAGILNTTDPSINSGTVIISYATADDFLDLEGLITEIDIGLERRVNLKDMIADAAEIKQIVNTDFPTLVAITFMEYSASFLEIAKGKRAFGVVFLLILLLIAGIGIFNTVLMSVYERIREVGVLRAHGMPPAQVTIMFLMEGFITGVIGASLGLLLGGGITAYLVKYGVPLDKMMGDSDVAGSMPFWGTIYAEWNPKAFLVMLIFGVLVSVLAGVIPARKAGKLKVTEALRFN